jgi:hypothetical protein
MDELGKSFPDWVELHFEALQKGMTVDKFVSIFAGSFCSAYCESVYTKKHVKILSSINSIPGFVAIEKCITHNFVNLQKDVIMASDGFYCIGKIDITSSKKICEPKFSLLRTRPVDYGDPFWYFGEKHEKFIDAHSHNDEYADLIEVRYLGYRENDCCKENFTGDICQTVAFSIFNTATRDRLQSMHNDLKIILNMDG